LNIDDKIAFGEKVRKYRKEKGLSQSALAEGICHESTISQLERGTFTPSGTILKKICEKLGIGTNELLDDHKEKIEVDTLLDIIKIHIQRGELTNAVDLISTLKERDDLAKYQGQELALCEADCLMRTGKSRHAIVLLTDLHKLLEQDRETDKFLVASVLNRLGNAYFFISNMIDAYSYYLRAYEIAEQLPQFDLLSAYICYNLGNVCRMLNKDSEGVLYVAKAQRFFEQTEDMNRLADTLFVLGISQSNMNNIKEASNYLSRSRHLYESLEMVQMAEEVKYAYAYLVLNKSGSYDDIDKLLETSKTPNSQLKSSSVLNPTSRAYSCALVAWLSLEQGDLDVANVHLHEAFTHFTEDMAKTDSKLAFVYYTYARYLLVTGDLEQAIENAQKSAQFFDNMNFDRLTADSYILLKQAYEQMGDLNQVIRVSDLIIQKLRGSLDRRSYIERG